MYIPQTEAKLFHYVGGCIEYHGDYDVNSLAFGTSIQEYIWRSHGWIIPEGFRLFAKCGNSDCCHAEHLDIATESEINSMNDFKEDIL